MRRLFETTASVKNWVNAKETIETKDVGPSFDELVEKLFPKRG